MAENGFPAPKDANEVEKVMRECHKEILLVFELQPMDTADTLFSKYLISEEAYERLLSLQDLGINKARQMIIDVKKKIKNNPQDFMVFLEVLRDNDAARSLVTKLEKSVISLQPSIPVAEDSSTSKCMDTDSSAAISLIMDTSVVNAQRNSMPSSLNELQLHQTLPIDVVCTRDDTFISLQPSIPVAEDSSTSKCMDTDSSAAISLIMDTSVVNAQRNSRPSSLNELQLQQTLPIDVVGTRDDTVISLQPSIPVAEDSSTSKCMDLDSSAAISLIMDTSVVNAQRNSRPSSLNELQLQQTLPINVVGTTDDTGFLDFHKNGTASKSTFANGDGLSKKKSVCSAIKMLENKFRNIQATLLNELKAVKTSVDDLTTSLSCLTPSINRYVYLSWSKIVEKDFKNLNVLFTDLNATVWTILDYYILQCFINTFGSEKLVEKMEIYAMELKIFMKETLVSDFIVCWEEAQNTRTIPGFEKIKIKCDKENTTLADLDEFRKKFAIKFLPSLSDCTSLIYFETFQKGSCVVTFNIPYELAVYLQNKCFQNCQLFDDFKLIHIFIGKSMVYDRSSDWIKAVAPSIKGKEEEVGRVHSCCISRPNSVKPVSSTTAVDIAKKAYNISDEIILKSVKSSHKDNSELENTVSNAHATKDFSPVTSSKETCEHYTTSADMQSFVKIEKYPGLNFFNQSEEREIKCLAEEQHLEMKDMGLSMTIPSEAIVPLESPVLLTVAPAVHGSIKIPEDCKPHSPMYMLSPCKLAKDAKVTVSHTCFIEDEEDSKNMVVLVPVNLAEAQTSGVYTLKEVHVEKKFDKGSQKGEIKLRLLQPFRVAKRLTRRPDNKLYTVRVYKKNPSFCTPDDIVVFSVTPHHASYIKDLEDKMKKCCPDLVLSENYDSLHFKDECNKITLLIPKSEDIGKWEIYTMKNVLTREEIDPPDGCDITNLHYPPMIRLHVINNRPQPSQNGTKCSIKVHGFLEDFEIKLIFELLEIKNQLPHSFQLHKNSISNVGQTSVPAQRGILTDSDEVKENLDARDKSASECFEATDLPVSDEDPENIKVDDDDDEVEDFKSKSFPEEMMTDEIESEVLKEYPQLPVVRQSEDDTTITHSGFSVEKEISVTYKGEKSSVIWKEGGILIMLEEDKDHRLQDDTKCSIQKFNSEGEYSRLPHNSVVVSQVYFINTSKPLKRTATIRIYIQTKKVDIDKLHFFTSTAEQPPYDFKAIKGGYFTNTYGEIKVKRFSFFTICHLNKPRRFQTLLNYMEKSYEVSLRCSKQPSYHGSKLEWKLYLNVTENINFIRSNLKTFIREEFNDNVEQVSSSIVKFNRDVKSITVFTSMGNSPPSHDEVCLYEPSSTSIRKADIRKYTDGCPPGFVYHLIAIPNIKFNIEFVIKGFEGNCKFNLHQYHLQVENTEKKFIPEEVMTEEIESELLLYHPPLPVAKQSKDSGFSVEKEIPVAYKGDKRSVIWKEGSILMKLGEKEDHKLQDTSKEEKDHKLQGVSEEDTDHRLQGASEEDTDHRLQGASEEDTDHILQSATEEDTDHRLQDASEEGKDYRLQAATKSSVQKFNSGGAYSQLPSNFEVPNFFTMSHFVRKYGFRGVLYYREKSYEVSLYHSKQPSSLGSKFKWNLYLSVTKNCQVFRSCLKNFIKEEYNDEVELVYACIVRMNHAVNSVTASTSMGTSPPPQDQVCLYEPDTTSFRKTDIRNYIDGCPPTFVYRLLATPSSKFNIEFVMEGFERNCKFNLHQDHLQKLCSSTPFRVSSLGNISSDNAGSTTDLELDQVLEEVFDAKAKWMFIGLKLGVPKGELDVIQYNGSSVGQKLMKTLDIWLQSGRNTTWKALAEAMGADTVGREDLKQNILTHS